MERFEVLVWSDLYAQKGHLFQENQLIYAILQVDKQEGNLKLQCKCLENLQETDDKVIKKFDELYDKLKENAQNYEIRKKRKMNFAKKNESFIEGIVIRVDAKSLRFSKILELKKIIKMYPGKTKVEIEFFSGDKRVGHIEADSMYRINYNDEVKNKILSLRGISNIAIS